MLNESIKFLSNILKFIGIAFWTPIGTLAFKWLIGEEMHGYKLILSLSAFVLGLSVLVVSYNLVKEKEVKINGSE